LGYGEVLKEKTLVSAIISDTIEQRRVE